MVKAFGNEAEIEEMVVSIIKLIVGNGNLSRDIFDWVPRFIMSVRL
jgi:hypothetical protein